MYESNFSVAVLPSNVMPPPLPPSPSYTMPPPPPPLHIEMPQLWQESEAAADGICLRFCCVFLFPLFMLDFSRFWEANNLGRKKFQPVCQWFVWISCFASFTWPMRILDTSPGGWNMEVGCNTWIFLLGYPGGSLGSHHLGTYRLVFFEFFRHFFSRKGLSSSKRIHLFSWMAVNFRGVWYLVFANIMQNFAKRTHWSHCPWENGGFQKTFQVGMACFQRLYFTTSCI